MQNGNDVTFHLTLNQKEKPMSKQAKNCTLTFFSIAVCLLYFMHDAAEARLGGGKSFGSKPSYSAVPRPPPRAYLAAGEPRSDDPTKACCRPHAVTDG